MDCGGSNKGYFGSLNRNLPLFFGLDQKKKKKKQKFKKLIIPNGNLNRFFVNRRAQESILMPVDLLLDKKSGYHFLFSYLSRCFLGGLAATFQSQILI